MVYLISTVVLLLVFAGFFLLARGRYRPVGRFAWVLRVIVAVPLLVSGVAHFTHTELFAGIVPPFFPAPRLLVVVSGFFELAGAVGLFLPATRRAAAVSLALLMIAIFPANVYAANRVVGGLHMPGVPVRTAMQVIYIVLLLVAGWGIPLLGKSKGRSVQATSQ